MLNPPFERIPPELGSGPRVPETLLGEVTDVQDPDSRGRVKVKLYAFDGADGQDGPIWCRVALPVAGSSRGTWLMPDVGDEVLVSFVGGDTRFPVVIGSLYNGHNTPIEEIHGQNIDRWVFEGRNGTKVSVIEENTGQAQIKMELPNGTVIEMKEESGGKIKLDAGGSSIEITPSGVTVQTSGQVQIQGSTMSVSAGSVTVDSALASFSGVVRCTTLQATTVVGTVYTPGAGNIW